MGLMEIKTEENLKSDAVISNLEESYAVILNLHRQLDVLKYRLRSATGVITKLRNTPSNCDREKFLELFKAATDHARIHGDT